jgi:hypothetical protein
MPGSITRLAALARWQPALAGPAAAALPEARFCECTVASAAAADGRKAHPGWQWPGIEMGGSHHRPSVPGPGPFALRVFSSYQPESLNFS